MRRCPKSAPSSAAHRPLHGAARRHVNKLTKDELDVIVRRRHEIKVTDDVLRFMATNRGHYSELDPAEAQIVVETARTRGRPAHVVTFNDSRCERP
jgi:hypothetical protein